MNKILVNPIVKDEINHSRKKPEPIRFKNEHINKIKSSNYDFGKKKELLLPFKVDKDSYRKGLKLKIYKGKPGEPNNAKTFYIQFWLNDGIERTNKKGQKIYGQSITYRLGKYSQKFGVEECDTELKDLFHTHTDKESGLWIKNPNETRKNKKRIVEKPDTTQAKGYTINEVIEAYCGAKIYDEEVERGFSKDSQEGFRTSKSCRTYFRCMAGYNKRTTLINFYDDDSGGGVPHFTANKHLRVARPVDMTDLFKKYPPGKGILKDREYYNRRKKQHYTIPASKNKSIYDSDLGKSLIKELKPGDIEHWIKDLSSQGVKEDYLKVFISLWIYARKRGWLGTNPGQCPYVDDQVYIKKDEVRKVDPYKEIAMESDRELEIFWECSEELSSIFPWKAELHQFMLLTAIRKQEALKMKKEYIDFEKGILTIPKGIDKKRKKDQQLPIPPELEILLRNILDMKIPGCDFYQMKDFPWLFATRKWSSDKYFNKEFRHSHRAHLGGDENYIPKLRAHMKARSGDDDLVYAPKILRKSYITLSQQKHGGRSEITQQMSRHGSIEVLNKHYNHPSMKTKLAYASEVSKVFKFIKRRSA